MILPIRTRFSTTTVRIESMNDWVDLNDFHYGYPQIASGIRRGLWREARSAIREQGQKVGSPWSTPLEFFFTLAWHRIACPFFVV
jgi:hypothetical protein